MTGVGAHRDVGNGGVFGFSRAVADDGGIACALGHFDGGKGLAQGSNLVDLDEDGVGNALVYAFLQNFGVSDKQIVSHQLHFFVQAIT